MTHWFDKISIIIPAKNEEKYISGVLEALFSAINNYAGNCEIIVVDNGSTDKTSSIASDFGCKVINAPLVTSIASLRNKGVKSSSGDIIAFLDADCLVDRDWINCCVERLADPKIGLVGTRAIPDLNTATWVEEGWYGLVSGVERPDYPRWIGSSNMFIRRDVFFEIGEFDESLETAEDVELCNAVAPKYLVCLEKRVNTIHLRESKTISEMVKREVWRGKSSLRQILISKNKISELISVLIPLSINLFFILSMIGVYLNSGLKLSWLGIAFLPIAMIFYKKVNCKKLSDFYKVYFVCLVYLISRAVAIIVEIFIMLRQFVVRV